jgi:rhomboid family GlyGly-CTERM serine protease
VGAPHRLRGLPWWSIGLVAACLAATAISSVADLLIYEREAIARGEWWRLFTGHIVHYSRPHLLNNVLVLVPAAVVVEWRSRRELIHVLAMSATAIGLSVLVFEPGILRYAGASGISLGLVTYAALRGMDGNARWRVVCGLVLIVVAGKLAAESFFAWQLVDWEREAGFITVKLAHVAGVASGLLVWCVQFARERRTPLDATNVTGINRLRHV